MSAANVLPLPQLDAPTPAMATVQPAAAIEPVAVGREDAARLVGVSVATWDRLASAGKTPAATRIGCRRTWSVAELRAWFAAGAPDQKQWEAIKAAANRRAKK